MLPPIESIDIHSTSTAIQHILDSLDSTSTLLSDAAAAAVTPEDKGWWENYLNLYKDLLLAVHSTIDGPLRNTGWDQTWGVSIALFTASEFLKEC